MRNKKKCKVIGVRCKVLKVLIILYTLHFTLYTLLYSTQPTAEFLRINPSAFSSAMAGADVSVSGKIDSIYSNPSGLATIKSPQLLTAYTSYIQNVKLGSASFAKPFGKNVYGISVIYLGLNALEDARDDSGQELNKTASANNFAFALSFARNIRDNFGVGVSVKQIHQNYDDVVSNGFSADVGGMYKLKNVSFGLSLQNFGPEIDNQKLPSTIRAGALYIFPKKPLKFSAEIEKPVYSNLKFKTGAECEVAPKIYFRGGYEYLREAGAFSGVSAGLGFKTVWQESYMEENPVKKIGVNLDYAFSYFGELGNIHKVSMGFEF